MESSSRDSTKDDTTLCTLWTMRTQPHSLLGEILYSFTGLQSHFLILLTIGNLRTERSLNPILSYFSALV